MHCQMLWDKQMKDQLTTANIHHQPQGQVCPKSDAGSLKDSNVSNAAGRTDTAVMAGKTTVVMISNSPKSLHLPANTSQLLILLATGSCGNGERDWLFTRLSHCAPLLAEGDHR